MTESRVEALRREADEAIRWLCVDSPLAEWPHSLNDCMLVERAHNEPCLARVNAAIAAFANYAGEIERECTQADGAIAELTMKADMRHLQIESLEERLAEMEQINAGLVAVLERRLEEAHVKACDCGTCQEYHEEESCDGHDEDSRCLALRVKP